MRISTFRFLSSQSFIKIHACPPFQPRGTRLFAHVCGVLRRLGTYLRQLLWYMEVAPKFPRGVVRLLAALFSLSLSLKQPSVFSPRRSPCSFDFRVLSSLTCLFIPRSTTNHLAFSQAFARSFGRRVSAFGGDSGSFAALSSRVHVELSRLRSTETVLMDFEILLRLNYTHEIT